MTGKSSSESGAPSLSIETSVSSHSSGDRRPSLIRPRSWHIVQMLSRICLARTVGDGRVMLGEILDENGHVLLRHLGAHLDHRRDGFPPRLAESIACVWMTRTE